MEGRILGSNIQAVIQDFVYSLTVSSIVETQRYVDEIVADNRFHDILDKGGGGFGGRRFSSRGMSIGTTLGIVLYTLCRKLQPDTVVETGVASGVSSSFILNALEANKHGVLYSIDLPRSAPRIFHRRYFVTEEMTTATHEKGQSGWIIPDYLRHRWQLIQGRSSDELLPLLEKLGLIDLFLHDSEHTYQNMLWEYQIAWSHLSSGGILLSHNIDASDAFPDFCQSVGAKSYTLNNLGGIVKA